MTTAERPSRLARVAPWIHGLVVGMVTVAAAYFTQANWLLLGIGGPFGILCVLIEVAVVGGILIGFCYEFTLRPRVGLGFFLALIVVVATSVGTFAAMGPALAGDPRPSVPLVLVVLGGAGIGLGWVAYYPGVVRLAGVAVLVAAVIGAVAVFPG